MSERIVEVEWEDCASRHRWQPLADRYPSNLNVHSVGYVLEDNDSHIVLTESLDTDPIAEDKLRGCTSTIPRSAIRKVTELKRGRRN
jgi:hypothetical protein